MYKIGDKVETPLGIGKLSIVASGVMVNIKGHEVVFKMDEISLYHTAHEKLIEMGYERVEDEDEDCFVYKKGLDYVTITKSGEVAVHDKNTYFGASYFDLTLSRILTQYLEELNETPST